MANRWPISSGNWSDTAIWSGSIKPTAADDVYANNQTVYVNEDITVLTLRNAASASAITLGGAFYLNNAITASTTAANGLISQIASTPLVYVTGSNDARINSTMNTTTGIKIRMQDSATLTVSGTLYGGNTTGAYSVLHVSTGNLFITGNLTCGTSTNMPAVYMSGSGGTYILGNVNGVVGHCFENIGSGEIVVNGNITAGVFTNGRGIINSGTGNITVYGNLIGNINTPISNTGTGNIFISGNIQAGTVSGVGISNTSTGNITVIGTITASSAASNPAAGISNTSTAIIQVTGSIVGGRANGITTAGDTYVSGTIFGGALGVGISTTRNLYVTGSVYGGTGGSGISTTSAGTYIINGPIYAGSGSTGISSTSTTAVNFFTGPFYNTGSFNAVYAYRMQIFNQPTSWTFDTEVAGTQKTLTTVESIVGVPASANVRNGVTYGLNGNLTGSLAMPDPTVVKQGVATDNTTGSAIFTAEDMFGVLTQNITTSGSIGTLLTGASTVQTVGATIASFKV
jgi:hypothetical protein